MTMFSGAFDKSVIDGNTILFILGKKNDRHRYVYNGGKMVCSILTNDNIYEFISKMGNKLTPYSIAVGDENIYFLTPYFIFIRRDKIDYDELLKTNENSLVPYDYHV